MKNFTQATVITLLISSSVFAQKDNPGTQVVPSKTTVMVGALHGNITLLSPADGKEITLAEASKPVLFRWTAVSPKPEEAVTYRLKLWQLMQGQTSAEAMHNQPVITKEVVNITQAAISNLYTGPCRPPYLCEFLWAVEVVGADGGSISNGSTIISSFSYEGNKGNTGNSGMAGGKSLVTQGDPVHGVDIKPGLKKQEKSSGKEKSSKSTNTTSWDIKELKKV